MISNQQIGIEYSKCAKDKTRIYMIENYLTTFDATKNDTVPFKLFPRQKIFLRNLSKNINNVTTKPRQAGVSTVICAYFACELALTLKNKPETVLIIANNLELSKEDLTKIKEFLEQIPRWFWGSKFFGTEEKEKKSIFIKANEKHLRLFNNSKVYSRSAGPNASRGISSVTRLLFDEAAFIEDTGTITSAISTTAASAKTVAYVSTPNGQDLVYFPVYNQAKSGKNGYSLSEFRWYQDPRYNRNLIWTKFDKETGETDIIKEITLNNLGDINYDEEHWDNMVKNGYKPTSDWYDSMCERYNHDKQKISQELDVSFLGSAGTVIDEELIKEYEDRYINEPIYYDNYYRDAWIFKEPIEGHRYVSGIDVSTGSGDDSSVIQILDIDAIDENGIPCIEQVFEYQGKLQGDILGELADKYCRYYGNAFTIIDCIGSSGDACAFKMQSLGYPNLYYDDANIKNFTSENPKLTEVKNDKKIPGFRAGYLRHQMFVNLEKMMRFYELKINSKRFVSELKTFIWKNGREDHQSGAHDDTITSISMALFIYQFSIKKLEMVKEKNIAILKSMVSVQMAINTNTVQVMSEKTKSKPLPFYTNRQLDSSSMKNTEETNKNKILNKYLINQMNQFIRR